ncbi:hypothetical protein RN001_012047 [Aquatica leii]|uniref:Uncharacterized protein n=1 Tax=Aquatica leii TaxID=1421715 RepID=A0AAN7SPB8_9COLE|nr:hypothetical protein RN001_012047 [Aquatica leii]
MTAKLILNTSIRPGRKKNDPTVNQLKCLKYESDGIIYYKTDYQEECYAPLPQRLNVTRVFHKNRILCKYRIGGESLCKT